MKLIQKLSNSTLVKKKNLLHIIIIILSVIGPVITVSAGFWDAIISSSKSTRIFLSPSHMFVYTGVSMTASCCNTRVF